MRKDRYLLEGYAFRARVGRVTTRRGARRRGVLALGFGLAVLAACLGGPTPPGGSTPAGNTTGGAAPDLATDLATVDAMPTTRAGSAASAPPSATSPSPVLPAPAPAPTTSPTPARLPPTIGEDTAVIIYTLVAHDLVTQSQVETPAKSPPPYIGINPHAGRGALLDTDSSTESIPPDLIDNLADLGTTVTFVAFVDAVGSLENGGQVRDGGIYLTLGTLAPQDTADRVALYGSFYRATTDATGYRYTLDHVADGPWTIMDRQQVWDH